MLKKVLDKPEIWRVQVDLPQNPLKYLNCYVLPRGEHPLIIDTGFNRPECWQALSSGLEELGVDLSKASLFLTHLHSDHCGLAGQLADRGCTVYMSGIDYDYLTAAQNNGTWPAMEERFRSEGFPQEDIEAQNTGNQARLYAPNKPLFQVVRVSDGDRFTFGGENLLAIGTPGHTKGHLCLYLEEHQIMFTGDHVLFDITPNITSWLNMTDALGEYLESLKKIKAFPVKLALPGHREFEMPMAERVEQIETHHAVRLGHVLEHLKAEPGLTAFQVAQRLPWSMRGKSWADFPVTARWFAMGETLSHLDYLTLRGKVERREEQGELRYYLA